MNDMVLNMLIRIFDPEAAAKHQQEFEQAMQAMSEWFLSLPCDDA